MQPRQLVQKIRCDLEVKRGLKQPMLVESSESCFSGVRMAEEDHEFVVLQAK